MKTLIHRYGRFLHYVDIVDTQVKSFDKIYYNLGKGGEKCAIEKERSIIEATDVRDDQTKVIEISR